MRDETEITQSFEPLPPVAPPEARPPRFLLRDAGPWLAFFALLVVAGLLVWAFVFRDQAAQRHVVPAVVGLRQQQAIPRLTGSGYNVKAIIGASVKPRGIVVSQSPGGGSQLPQGSSVTLRISNGHPVQVVKTPTTRAATTTTAKSASAAIPDVVGQDAASAAGQVEAAGLVAQTDPVGSSGTPGTVVGESPSAGSHAAAGSAVKLSIATGSSRPPQPVPNVVGRQAAAARAALLQAKLTVRTEYRRSTKQRVGVVLGETPAGTQPAWTQITIVVGH